MNAYLRQTQITKNKIMSQKNM